MELKYTDAIWVFEELLELSSNSYMTRGWILTQGMDGKEKRRTSYTHKIYLYNTMIGNDLENKREKNKRLKQNNNEGQRQEELRED